MRHAYGPASDIPDLLHRAETDLRHGHEPDSTWFRLWSALCHQGDAYSASYAAVPMLVGLAERKEYRENFEPLFLIACIEVARLEGTGPELPDDLVIAYRAALTRGLELSTKALENSALDEESVRAFRVCIEAFRGRLTAARRILDADDEGAE